MNDNTESKRASYTLFSVTQEDRTKRSARIREFFKVQPALAYLMAAFDFEWTVRRAILLLGKCPIPVIKARFDNKRYAGWSDYQGAWTCCVQKTRNDGTPTLGRVIFGGPSDCDISKEERASVQKAMEFRNRLVHGLSGSIPADEAKEKFKLLLTASERITNYVDDHSERRMFSIANRPLARCNKCPRRKRCKFPDDKAIAKKTAAIKREMETQNGQETREKTGRTY